MKIKDIRKLILCAGALFISNYISAQEQFTVSDLIEMYHSPIENFKDMVESKGFISLDDVNTEELTIVEYKKISEKGNWRLILSKYSGDQKLMTDNLDYRLHSKKEFNELKKTLRKHSFRMIDEYPGSNNSKNEIYVKNNMLVRLIIPDKEGLKRREPYSLIIMNNVHNRK